MEITHQELDNNVSLIRLNGRLDARTSLEVKAALQELLKDQGHRKIIIDLEEVPFIDSSGLAALVSGLRLARENKGDIVLSGAQSQAQIVFRLTMLDRIFAIHPTAEEARQSLL
jgi:anti-sigma B factor antagonist